MTPALACPNIADCSSIDAKLTSKCGAHADALSRSDFSDLRLRELRTGMSLSVEGCSVSYLMRHVLAAASPLEVGSSRIGPVPVDMRKFAVQYSPTLDERPTNESVYGLRSTLTLARQHHDRIAIAVGNLGDRARWREVKRANSPKIGHLVKPFIIRARQPAFHNCKHSTRTAALQGDSAGPKGIAQTPASRNPNP